eukprot:scaffold19531_cov44-Prasinocladus_malaysianus.AAC.2
MLAYPVRYKYDGASHSFRSGTAITARLTSSSLKETSISVKTQVLQCLPSSTMRRYLPEND